MLGLDAVVTVTGFAARHVAAGVRVALPSLFVVGVSGRDHGGTCVAIGLAMTAGLAVAAALRAVARRGRRVRAAVRGRMRVGFCLGAGVAARVRVAARVHDAIRLHVAARVSVAARLSRGLRRCSAVAAGRPAPARVAAASIRMAAAASPALALAFPFLAVAVPADGLLVMRRLAVLALSDRGSTRVIACFALALTVVSRQSRRRASKHEKESGHQDESV